MAIYFWSQFSNDINDDFYKMTDILNCATMLLEIGHSISHNSYHKHSSYLVSNSDMSGFSRGEQQLMSKLILGHVGKLAKVVEIIHNKSSRRALVCIRLASIFARSRIDLKPPKMILLDNEDKFVLNISENWLKSHPLTLFTLEQETKEWKKFNRIFTIKNLTEI
ncbi:MAG: hypothetical protein CBD16_01520 [Betaproteobacteria bacterium TMED156]|nr:MAG: hypothetical protein CBD16_01520 [Betaproteobacteria bacterium TMED156]